MKIEEKLDQSQKRVQELERDLQRRADEVILRKEVIDSMGDKIMNHENDTYFLKAQISELEEKVLNFEIKDCIGKKY